MTTSSVSGSPARPPGALARLGRGPNLLHTCQKWRSWLMPKTNRYPSILLVRAGGRVQKNRRARSVSASRGSQSVGVPPGLDAHTPTAEVINLEAHSHVMTVCNLLTPTLVLTVRRNLLIGVEVVEEVAIEDTVELM